MKKIRKLNTCMIFLLLTSSINVFGQQVIPLYEGEIPNSIKAPNKEFEDKWHCLEKISQPELTIYTPPAGLANGTAVIICPGGGYAFLNIKGEGYSVAERLNTLGITAFVLKYRLPDDSIMIDKSVGPLQDAQKAILLVKTRAKVWNIDTAKVGIMGFSAGGHLAASAGTHFNQSFISNPSNISLRPNFLILVYPVISFTDSLAHKDSRTALIGTHPSASQIVFFSNELQANSSTPPTFLIHAGNDSGVSVKNSIVFYLALLRNKVSAGMHIFPKGAHGFTMRPARNTWFQYCTSWLQENEWIKPL